MLALVTRKTARLATAARAHKAAGACAAARALSTSTEAPATTEEEAAVKKPKQQQQQQPEKSRQPLVFAAEGESAAEGERAAAPAPRHRSKKKFSFASAPEPEPELETFEYPAYWDQDFPEGFDNAMKHEVEKLELFSDFAALMDDAWEKQIHPQFDGAGVKLSLNCPLEDFDERLFVDDKTTYDTKVTMEVPLSCFKGLDRAALDVVKQLAGPRYNPRKRLIKLTEDRYPTRVYNHKRLCDILHDLTATALELSAEAKKAEA